MGQWLRLLILILKLVNDFLDFLSGTLSELPHMVQQSLTQLEVPLHIILSSYDLVDVVLELEIPSFLLVLIVTILHLLALIVVTFHVLLDLVGIVAKKLGLTSVALFLLIIQEGLAIFEGAKGVLSVVHEAMFGVPRVLVPIPVAFLLNGLAFLVQVVLVLELASHICYIVSVLVIVLITV